MSESIRSHKRSDRLTALDGIRGIAAVSVVIFHYTYYYDVLFGHPFTPWAITAYGRYGVQLFFMLSGFVIFWSLTRLSTPATFLWTRFIRLYPPYWVAMTLTFFTVSLTGLPLREVSIQDYVLNFTMLQCYLGVPYVDGVYWSLNLELAFYFFLFLFFCLKQLNHIEKWLIPWICVATFISIRYPPTELDTRLVYLFLVRFIEFFGLGIALFRIREKQGGRWPHALILTALVATALKSPVHITLGVMAAAGGFHLAVTGRLPILATRIPLYLGRISYPLYLIHQNIGFCLMNRLYQHHVPAWATLTLAFAAAILLAEGLHRFIEIPCRKTLKYIFTPKPRRQHMEFNILNRARRSINFFDPDTPVPRALLEDMISLAAQSPSSFNLQPWNLMIISEPRDKARLRKLAWDQPKVTEAPVTLIVLADQSGWKEGHPTLEKHWEISMENGAMNPDQREWFLGATKELYGRNDQAAIAFAAKNAGFFAMSLMYAATHLGLSSHPMDGFDHDGVRKEFNIPKHYWVPLLLAVGYMKPDMDLHPPKWRKNLDELVVEF